MNLKEFETIIKKSWSSETSSPSWRENWNKENPSAGQCAITALLVNDYFGGEIMRCMTSMGSHYYNRIDGEIVDFTVEQFGNEIPDYNSGEPRSRDYLLSSPDTKQRYELLKNNFEKLMDGHKLANQLLDENEKFDFSTTSSDIER